MESWYQIQTGLIAAIICLALAINVLIRGRGEALMRRFAWFNLNLVAWFLIDALTLAEALPVGVGSTGRAIVASLLPATCIGFFAGFAAEITRQTVTVRRLANAVSAALLVSVLLGWPERETWRQWILFGALALSLLLALVQMGLRVRTLESKVDRARLKYVVLAGVAVFGLLLLEFGPGLHTASAGRILTAIYMYFLFQVVTRRRILDLFEFVGRFAVMSGSAIVLSLIYVLLVGWWRYDLGLFIFNTIIAAVVMLILFDPVRTLVEDQLRQLIFREKFEFTKVVERLRAELANVIDARAMIDTIIEHLGESRRITHASVYLFDDDGLSFSCIGQVGASPISRLDAIQARPFTTRLLSDQVIAVENLQAEGEELKKRGTVEDQAKVELLDAIIGSMEACQAALVMGFVSNDQLLGFLCIRDERLPFAFATDEIKALMALAVQATITLENSRLFDRVRERDRLAALGEMAAGLAHEIRNPLGAIKGAAQLLEEGGSAPVDRAYLSVITEEVNRLNGVVSQFLTYARPIKPSTVGIDINEVLEKTLTLLNVDDHPCEITFDGAPNLPAVRAEAELVRQVTLNLVRNGIEAMGEAGGALSITTSLTRRRGGAAGPHRERTTFVRVRFADEGPGIPPEVVDRLFIPFYTTKTHGTGLGLAICQRIVRSLGGTVDVSSRVGSGTVFTITLPAEEVSGRTTSG
jgi:nitrogen-specific signal transduction histidine kinase